MEFRSRERESTPTRIEFEPIRQRKLSFSVASNPKNSFKFVKSVNSAAKGWKSTKK
jgi:hypothetical protein